MPRSRDADIAGEQHRKEWVTPLEVLGKSQVLGIVKWIHSKNPNALEAHTITSINKWFIIFQTNFRFTAKLKRIETSLHPMAPSPSTACPTINVAHQGVVHMLQLMNLSPHHHHPKPVVYLRLHLWWCMFPGFGPTKVNKISPPWYYPERPLGLCLFIPLPQPLATSDLLL